MERALIQGKATAVSCKASNAGGGLLEEFQRQLPRWAEALAGASTHRELRALADHLFNDLIERIDAQEHTQDSLREQIHQFMVANLHRGLTLKDMAAFLGYSEKYCSDVFQALMGEPFSQSLKRLRLEKAEQLLRETDVRLAVIAHALGFHDQFAFSHFFKRAVGCSPRQFRAQSHRPQLSIRPPSERSLTAS
jgi:AraC-like DNA-binding protein